MTICEHCKSDSNSTGVIGHWWFVFKDGGTYCVSCLHQLPYTQPRWDELQAWAVAEGKEKVVAKGLEPAFADRLLAQGNSFVSGNGNQLLNAGLGIAQSGPPLGVSNAPGVEDIGRSPSKVTSVAMADYAGPLQYVGPPGPTGQQGSARHKVGPTSSTGPVGTSPKQFDAVAELAKYSGYTITNDKPTADTLHPCGNQPASWVGEGKVEPIGPGNKSLPATLPIAAQGVYIAAEGGENYSAMPRHTCADGKEDKSPVSLTFREMYMQTTGKALLAQGHTAEQVETRYVRWASGYGGQQPLFAVTETMDNYTLRFEAPTLEGLWQLQKQWEARTKGQEQAPSSEASNLRLSVPEPVIHLHISTWDVPLCGASVGLVSVTTWVSAVTCTRCKELWTKQQNDRGKSDLPKAHKCDDCGQLAVGTIGDARDPTKKRHLCGDCYEKVVGQRYPSKPAATTSKPLAAGEDLLVGNAYVIKGNHVWRAHTDLGDVPAGMVSASVKRGQQVAETRKPTGTVLGPKELA